MIDVGRSQASRARVKATATRRSTRVDGSRPAGEREQKKRSLFDAVVIAAGLIGGLAAVVAAIFAIMTFVNQKSANDLAANANLEQYASKVYYTVGGQDVLITNASSAPISNVSLEFPQPLTSCASPCQWRAADFVDLPPVPGCEQLKFPVLSSFSDPAIGIKSENGSYMIFTDRNGNTWQEFGALNNKLVQVRGYKPPTGLLTLVKWNMTAVPGCT